MEVPISDEINDETIFDLYDLRHQLTKKTEVRFKGWVSKIQRFKRHAFVTIRDGPGLMYSIQVVVDQLPKVSEEAYVQITGILVDLPREKYAAEISDWIPGQSIQKFEVRAKEFLVLSDSDPDFQSRCPTDAGPDLKLSERHLYLRDPQFSLITKARSILIQAIRKHFESTHCAEIFPATFTSSECEGGASLFKVDHVGQEAYLTESSQFQLEYAVPSFGSCYCIAPSYRAEKSHTRRHLTEFLHAEAEWSGILTFHDHLEKLTELVRHTLSRFIIICDKEMILQQLGKRERVLELIKMEIIELSHKDAIAYCRTHEIYKHEPTKTHFGPRDDIPEAQERQMIDRIGKIVLLTKFPRETKSFYMASDPDDESYALGCDVEVPGVGEIIGSGVRVSKYDELLTRLTDSKMKIDDYKEYLDLRKYGHGKTSGMGLGVDRMLTWILGMHSIREVVTYPRYPGHLRP